jgi:hypothetical protein
VPPRERDQHARRVALRADSWGNSPTFANNFPRAIGFAGHVVEEAAHSIEVLAFESWERALLVDSRRSDVSRDDGKYEEVRAMPRLLTQIDSITIHPGEAGISTVSVWFGEGRMQHERVTFSPIDLFDYPLFCARVLEATGHPCLCREVDEAPDAWSAASRWRAIVSAKLEEAAVEPQGRYHWKPLLT